MEIFFLTAAVFLGAKICSKLCFYAQSKARETECFLERCSWLMGAANFALGVFVLCALGTLLLFEIGRAMFGSYQENARVFNLTCLCVSLLFSCGMFSRKNTRREEKDAIVRTRH